MPRVVSAGFKRRDQYWLSATGRDAVKMSFGERNVKGFKMGLSEGIEFFFGLGSVAYYVSLSVAQMIMEVERA